MQYWCTGVLVHRCAGVYRVGVQVCMCTGVQVCKDGVCIVQVWRWQMSRRKVWGQTCCAHFSMIPSLTRLSLVAARRSVRVSVRLSVCLSVCLSVSLCLYVFVQVHIYVWCISNCNNGISIGSAVFLQSSWQKVPILYNWLPLSPQNCPCPWAIWTLSNPCFLGPSHSASQTASGPVQPLLHSSRQSSYPMRPDSF